MTLRRGGPVLVSRPSAQALSVKDRLSKFATATEEPVSPRCPPALLLPFSLSCSVLSYLP